MRRMLGLLLLLMGILPLHAGEGMWIPLLLEKYTIQDMQEKGFRLQSEDIYSINQASLKDAVVIFGGGCTGEVVSADGLIFTNHHCGYRYIQSHSSVENDYLTHGFWAMEKSRELPNPGLSVSFLVRIEDVSEEILEGTENVLTEGARQLIISENIARVRKEAEKGNSYEAVVKPFYYGNEYYMFVYEVFKDVRLVGAPPGSIGNYGKDYDNWMWPRHTGDFSIFRIYADINNQPAEYSPDNIPYKPKKHLSISMKGLSENDFTMVMGYPGTTTQFFTSDAVRMLMETSYPHKIDLRDTRLEIMSSYMESDPEVRIKYASKYRSVSNSWKKWKGINRGLRKADVLSIKTAEESDFQEWADSDPQRSKEYGEVLSKLEDLYEELTRLILVFEYASEAVLAVEVIDYMVDFTTFLNRNEGKTEEEKIQALESFRNKTAAFFKDYHEPLDARIFVAMMEAYRKDIDPVFHPAFFKSIDSKENGDMAKYVEKIMKKTLFKDKEEVNKLLDLFPEQTSRLESKLMKDPLYRLFYDFSSVYARDVNTQYNFLDQEIQSQYRKYIKALREKNEMEKMWPDANFTMRITYGIAEGYTPEDAVNYDYHTTLSGIIEKYYTGLTDYSIPDRLMELYQRKDYGRYADENNEISVCFIASNHTSGGNSGSPVLNADGQLIGLNFDRNWEGTMSDIYYDVTQCRNITVDIRYVLFIIDKFAGAGYLLNEMDIVY